MSLHIYPEIEQRSEEWRDQRRGLVTASVVGKLVTYGPPDAISVACPMCEARPENPCISKARKEPTAIKTFHPARSEHAAGRAPVFSVADNETSRGLTETLIAERITGWTEDTPMNSDMWRGVEAEPYARDIYSQHHSPATEVGFMCRTEDGWQLGYSPDGLVGDDGLIEVKAPRAKTHLRTILADEVPAHHMAQLQAGLLVSGRKWVDFVSYVGGMPLYVKRVTPDRDWSDAIEAACLLFENTASRVIADYQERVHGLPQTERIDFNLVELKLA
ncbi:MAG TPA: YqaJ viral recombinase family protein [Galbitalea sp.]